MCYWSLEVRRWYSKPNKTEARDWKPNKSNITAKRLLLKVRSQKFNYILSKATCTWNLKLKFRRKLKLGSGNSSAYRRTDRQRESLTMWFQCTVSVCSKLTRIIPVCDYLSSHKQEPYIYILKEINNIFKIYFSVILVEKFTTRDLPLNPSSRRASCIWTCNLIATRICLTSVVRLNVSTAAGFA